MRSVGLDIGTTGLSAVLFCTEGRRALKVLSRPNHFMDGYQKDDAAEDPIHILASVREMLDELISLSPVDAISISSQMHGMLWSDGDGDAVSPLWTWQNRRGLSIEKELSDRLGYEVHTGYGIVTRFALPVPENASYFSTIGDWVAMKLSGRRVPVTSLSLASSMGIYDLASKKYTDKVSNEYFPELTGKPMVLGTYENIPVVSAIGDNQASFLGSVSNMEHTLLLNYGTGGQLSYYTDDFTPLNGFELRPLGEGYLNAANSLTGGDSYRILRDFFRRVITSFGLKAPENMYETMDGFLNESSPMHAVTEFLGRRDDTSRTASFSSVTKENFTPEAMTEAVVRGMAEELHERYLTIPEDERKGIRYLRGSGNGLRCNERLMKTVEEMYGMRLTFSPHEEESSVGAAINALVGIGAYSSLGSAVKSLASPQGT